MSKPDLKRKHDQLPGDSTYKITQERNKKTAPDDIKAFGNQPSKESIEKLLQMEEEMNKLDVNGDVVNKEKNDIGDENIGGGRGDPEEEDFREDATADLEGNWGDDEVEYSYFQPLDGIFKINVEAPIERKTKESKEGIDEEKQTVDPFAFNVITYRGIVEKDQTLDEEHQYVYASKHGLYIRVETLKERLEGSEEDRKKIYELDWQREEDVEKKKEKPFTVWNARGSYERVKPERTMFAQETRKSRKSKPGSRVQDQYELWMDVAKLAEKVKLPKFNTVGRYWDPKPILQRTKGTSKVKLEPTNFILRFEASDGVKKKVLNELIKKALKKCSCQPKYTVIGPGEGDKSAKPGNDGDESDDPSDDGDPSDEPSDDKSDKPSDDGEKLDKPRGDSKSWVFIGEHLFGLYKLYASFETVEFLRKEGQQLDPRPPPTSAQVKAANQRLLAALEAKSKKTSSRRQKQANQRPLVELPPPEAKSTETSLSQKKQIAVVGQDRGKSQKDVMGGVSATEFAKSFGWPENDDGTGWEDQAEWLHRSAFSFGGLNDTARKMTSQSPENFVFGTEEANTFMMRFEATIRHVTDLEHKRLERLLKRGKKPPRKTKITATVSTTTRRQQIYDESDKLKSRITASLNVRTDPEPKGGKKAQGGKKAKGGEKAEGMDVDAKPGVMDMEVDTKSDVMQIEAKDLTAETTDKKGAKQTEQWFPPQLEYAIQTELSFSNRKKNFKPIINLWSRVIPMRLEHELDYLLEEHLFKSGIKPDRRHSSHISKVGQYGKGTNRANDPLSRLNFTSGLKSEQPAGA